jgi:hypothetical protein
MRQDEHIDARDHSKEYHSEEHSKEHSKEHSHQSKEHSKEHPHSLKEFHHTEEKEPPLRRLPASTPSPIGGYNVKDNNNSTNDTENDDNNDVDDKDDNGVDDDGGGCKTTTCKTSPRRPHAHEVSIQDTLCTSQSQHASLVTVVVKGVSEISKVKASSADLKLEADYTRMFSNLS